MNLYHNLCLNESHVFLSCEALSKWISKLISIKTFHFKIHVFTVYTLPVSKWICHILGQHILCIGRNISNLSFKNKQEYIFNHSRVLIIFLQVAYNERPSIKIEITGTLFTLRINVNLWSICLKDDSLDNSGSFKPQPFGIHWCLNYRNRDFSRISIFGFLMTSHPLERLKLIVNILKWIILIARLEAIRRTVLKIISFQSEVTHSGVLLDFPLSACNYQIDRTVIGLWSFYWNDVG